MLIGEANRSEESFVKEFLAQFLTMEQRTPAQQWKFRTPRWVLSIRRRGIFTSTPNNSCFSLLWSELARKKEESVITNLRFSPVSDERKKNSFSFQTLASEELPRKEKTRGFSSKSLFECSKAVSSGKSQCRFMQQKRVVSCIKESRSE